jgi:hypothetical protein
VLATNRSPLGRKYKALKDLEGQKLLDVHLNKDNVTTRFVFDLGAILEVRGMQRASDVWLLYGPKVVLTLEGNGTVSRERRG